MNDLPNPLTPPDCDLRDFPFMPLDVQRLRDSDLAADESPEACWAALLLWCVSWHQVPASSIPDDDEWIAKRARYWHRGKIDKEWEEVRAGALRGWIKCADGRLYHPVVAEKARDAWLAKLKQRFKTECARIKKHCQRHEIPYVEPDFDEWIDAGCPQGHSLSVPRTKHPRPEDNVPMSPGHGGNVPETPPECPDDKPPVSPDCPAKNDSKGQGEGEGQGEVNNLGSNNGNGTPLREGENTSLVAAEISKSLIGWERERGKAARNMTPSQQQVIDLAELNVSAAELRKAYEAAVAERDATNDPTAINAGFVRTFVDKHRRPPPKKREPQVSPWSMNDTQLNALGRELGIGEARRGEERDAYIGRIQQKQSELRGRAA
ncbi:DUF1376 domain-containing protein [Burkholderia anthina]|uniref:DUF1376 domain-containing protein n=1 Tax=Burkholderia anthina TaxID=179879 RepID=UPI001FC8060D|nr:DUF1376 domain-containing protein [Burkholderia anthina]